MEAKREKDGSEAVKADAATSEAPDRGNDTLHNTSENAIDLTTTSTQSSSFISTSTSTSLDDIPLTRIYKNL